LTKRCIAGLLALACTGLFIISSCSSDTQAEPSFYFWRTKATLSDTEVNALHSHGVRRLYVRFFDVDVPPGSHQPRPLGVIDSLGRLPANIDVIPVVFITNRTFLKLSNDSEVTALADNLLRKITGMQPLHSELQIDCDWSEKTRDFYFLFLKRLKQSLPASTLLSVTIRLHQVKYPIRSGIPPVDRGMLMFYNIGNLQDPESPNSIFDAATASAYTPYLKNYTLPLDAALPIFRWCVHYRNGRIIGLLTKKHLPQTSDTSYFCATGDEHFRLKQTGTKDGVNFETGDVLKYETIDDATFMQAAGILKNCLTNEHRRIVLYDLDDYNLNYYDKKTLQNVYSSFH